ncbi:MAG: transketolase [Beijerinckiaceae bacterium]|nr:transketolase [Beijerinckiaceae bacterium]
MATAARDPVIPGTAFADQSLDQVAINTIRTLTMDAVQKANSGHPGAPMALAPVAYTLWNKVLRYDPADPQWPNRDRFVLSCGHASMLLYALIHLAGVTAKAGSNEPAVSLDDIKNFRQNSSKTPGHPEYGLTVGVETTTGPLGAGCGNSVGMAMAAGWLGARYNKEGAALFDYNVYTLCSDGDLMEGVSSEAASLAGHLELSNLCWIYDSNTISIEGHTDLAFSENVAKRFEAYGWHVQYLPDANDTGAILAALETFKATKDKPTLIIANTVIGYGAPTKQGTHKAHSDALGVDEIRGAKKFYGWPEDASFLVPDGVLAHFAEGIGQRGAALNAAWKATFAELQASDPGGADEIERITTRKMPKGWDQALPVFPADAKGVATREASGTVINAIAKVCPWFIGGSADLAPSTKTWINGAPALQPATPGGRNVHFGVREHGMGAAVNGLALAGLRAFGSTFLVFSDYMRPPIRLSALMELPNFNVFTHDSIGVGEDGPTHQPVEHLAGLRSIPGLLTFRPADANEVAEAYRIILSQTRRPSALILSRQAMPTLDRSVYASARGLEKGAYILADAPEGSAPRVILVGTGSEVQLCVGAYEALKAEGIAARVVSMPSWELFEDQDQAYRDHVLPPAIKARVCVEQAAVLGWDRYAGPSGTIIGMHTFGASAPLKDLLTKFGFTPDKVLEAARQQIAKHEG